MTTGCLPVRRCTSVACTFQSVEQTGDWENGRPKSAVAAHLNLPRHYQGLRQIEILPDASGAPRVCVANESARLSISLTHREGKAACAITDNDIALGCDLEIIEPHSNALLQTTLLVKNRRQFPQSMVFSAIFSSPCSGAQKRVLSKPCETGLRADTRSVVINFLDVHSFAPCSPNGLNGWHSLQAHYGTDVMLHGWWQASGRWIRSLVSLSPMAPPIPLAIRNRRRLLAKNSKPGKRDLSEYRQVC